MPAEPEAKDKGSGSHHSQPSASGNGTVTNHSDNASEDTNDEGEEEEEEEEPRLKYTKLTGSLSSVYRNGDDTSSFIVAGDKMVWLWAVGVCIIW